MACEKSLEVEETLRKIKKYLECPICLELLSDPYTTQCGHSFCRQCIHTFIASTKNTKCPLCKVPITKRSMNKSACLGDIIDAVQNLEEAVQKDIGVMHTPPRTASHSHECSATPGLIIHSLLHPTPFKPISMPQSSSSVERNTSPVIQRKNKSNIRKASNRRKKKGQTRRITTDNNSSSSSDTVPVTAPVPEQQPSTSHHYSISVESMVTSHDADDLMTNMVSHTSAPPVECVREDGEPHLVSTSDDVTRMEQQGNSVEQHSSIKLFTSSTPAVSGNNNISPVVNITSQQKEFCDLLDDKSPAPIPPQDDVPLCCSTPDKMECGSSEAKRMSRSPSIPLQNTSMKMTKVDVTPIVLPQRMIALEGLYPDDSDSNQCINSSLDLFDDPLIPSSQSKNDQSVTVSSPALFTTDQQQSISQHRVDSMSLIDTNTMPSLPSPSLGDSISTQEIIKLQQELEQKQNEIASLDAAIQEKSIRSTDMAAVCSKDKSSFTVPSSSVETINDSLPPSVTQSSVTPHSPMITPSTQMNTVALFHCVDQILDGLKKTLKKQDRPLAPIDTNIITTEQDGSNNGSSHTPVHQVKITQPSSDQPRHSSKMSLSTHKRLNYSAELISSNTVSITTSGLALNEIERVQRLAEVCNIQYSNRLSSDTTHLVMATSNDRVCARTPKYLQGLLRGLWIISYDWITESLKAGVLVNEVDYEIVGDTICASNIPRRARMAKLRKNNEILASYTIALIGKIKEMGTRALTSLIVLAGGIPSHMAPTDINEKCSNDRVIMVCDLTSLDHNDIDVIKSSSSLTVVNLNWLLDSISCYKMKSFNDYLVK